MLASPGRGQGTARPQLCSPPRAQLHPGLPAKPGGGFSLPPGPAHLGQGSWLSTRAQEGSQQSRSRPPALPGVKPQQRQRSKCSGICCSGGPWGGAGWPPRAARPLLSVCFLLTSALSISCTPATGVRRVLSRRRQHRGRFRPVNGFLSCSITVSAGDAAPRRPDELPPPGLLPVSHGLRGFRPRVPAQHGAIPQKPSPGRTRGPPAGWVLAPRERVAAHAWLRPPRNLLDMDTFSKSDPGGWQGRAAGGASAAWQGTARLRSSLRSGRPLRAGRGEQ